MSLNKIMAALLLCMTILMVSGEVYAQDSSSDVSFYINRGYDYYDKGEYDLAITDYDKALKMEPRNPIALANRATAYAKKGDFDKAIFDYTEALETSPKDPKIYHDLGMTYAFKNDLDKAIDYFSKALDNEPDNNNKAQFYNDRAVAYFKKADYDKCWNDVNKATELGYSVNPQFLSALKEASGREQ